MRIAALFSGGKDSAYAAMAAVRAGHDLACLVTVEPPSPASELLHYPCVRAAALQAESVGVPHVLARAASDRAAAQEDAVGAALAEAAERHGARGAVHGGLRSEFQRRAFERACGAAGLEALAPAWAGAPGARLDRQMSYMRRLLAAGVRFAVTAVSAGGLGAGWLGRTVDAAALGGLEALSRRHGIGADFEGGEAETLVLDCPLFGRPLEIVRSRARWDGCRGELDIIEARLGPARARRAADQPAVGHQEDCKLVGSRQGARGGAGP